MYFLGIHSEADEHLKDEIFIPLTTIGGLSENESCICGDLAMDRG